MSYKFTAYFNDAGIYTTAIYNGAAGTYTKHYGDDVLSYSGFTGLMRFTATPDDGYEFKRWVYRLGSVTGEVCYSYDNPFSYTAEQDIYIRAESQEEGGGGSTGYSLETGSKGTVTAISTTYVNFSQYILKRYSVVFSQSGAATFGTTGAFDTIGYLSTSTAWDDSTGRPTNYIASDDDGGEDYNFQITANVTAGTTYYVWIRMYDPTETGQLSLIITPPGTTPVTGSGGFYVFTGGQWVKATPYIRTGNSWSTATPCIFTGSWHQGT